MSKSKLPVTALTEVLSWLLERLDIAPTGAPPDGQAEEEGDKEPWQVDDVGDEAWRRAWEVPPPAAAPAREVQPMQTVFVPGSSTVSGKGGTMMTIRAQQDFNLRGLRLDGPDVFKVTYICLGEDNLLQAGACLSVAAANETFRSFEKLWAKGTDLIIGIEADDAGRLNAVATCTRPEVTYTWRLVRTDELRVDPPRVRNRCC